MRPHLRYLRYVLLHKWYVFLNGMAIAFLRREEYGPLVLLAWMARLLVHDWSKFRPSEWGPYAAYFYASTPTCDCEDRPIAEAARRAGAVFQHAPRCLVATVKRDRQAAFNYAWLKHLHRNPHHWQHWILREDSGKQIVMLMPARLADEMTADWLSAGKKILRHPTLTNCVVETISWYVQNKDVMQLREPVRLRVEENLWKLAAHVGVMEAALDVQAAKAARVSITIPGR